jgi:hypothetical protein
MSEQDPGRISQAATALYEQRYKFVVGLAAAGLGAGVSIAAANSDSSQSSGANSYPVLVSDQSEALANCEDFSDANAAADASTYNEHGFLPADHVVDATEAKQYVLNLFSKEGPLAGQGDEASLAAIMSAVVIPSHEGAFESVDYDYLQEFVNTIGSFNSEGGLDRAKADCKEAYGTLIQDVGFNGDWANKGETVSELIPIRNKQNDIVNATLATGKVKSGSTFRGIEIALRPTTKGQNGYLSILISTDTKGEANGQIFIKGLNHIEAYGKNETQKGHSNAHVKHHNKPLAHGKENANGGATPKEENTHSQNNNSPITVEHTRTISVGHTNENNSSSNSHNNQGSNGSNSGEHTGHHQAGGGGGNNKNKGNKSGNTSGKTGTKSGTTGNGTGGGGGGTGTKTGTTGTGAGTGGNGGGGEVTTSTTTVTVPGRTTTETGTTTSPTIPVHTTTTESTPTTTTTESTPTTTTTTTETTTTSTGPGKTPEPCDPELNPCTTDSTGDVETSNVRMVSHDRIGQVALSDRPKTVKLGLGGVAVGEFKQGVK